MSSGSKKISGKLNSIESKFIDFVSENIIAVYFVVANLFLLYVRKKLLFIESGDYHSFLLPWFNQIKENGGFESLKMTIGNYNVLYMYFFTGLTYLKLDPLTSIKYLSIFFDILLAFASALLVYELQGRSGKAYDRALLTSTIVLMLPTVVLNSAAWAQCDSIYTAFMVLSLYSILKDRPAVSMIFFSIAFCFKLQAVFMFPLFLIIYFTNRKISAWHFLIFPVVNFAVMIPALIAGRPFKEILKIYTGQAGQYKNMTMNFPNVYALTPNNYEALSKMAVVTTIFILGTMAVYIINKRCSLTNKHAVLLVLWSSMTCVMFLPAMHERYGYIVDVLSVVYFVMINRKLIIPLMINFASTVAYFRFLFGYHEPDFKMLALINLAAYFLVSLEMLKEINALAESKMLAAQAAAAGSEAETDSAESAAVSDSDNAEPEAPADSDDAEAETPDDSDSAEPEAPSDSEIEQGEQDEQDENAADDAADGTLTAD